MKFDIEFTTGEKIETMTDAYVCYSCNDFSEGHPAVSVDIDGMLRQPGRDMVLEGGLTAEWPHGDSRVELCPSCAVDAIEWVGRYTSDYNEKNE